MQTHELPAVVFKMRASTLPHWSRGIEFLVRAYSSADPGHYYYPVVTWETGVSADIMPPDEPVVVLEQDQAQALMDDLWNCGLRPTEGKGSAGALAATEKHLEDMRKIAFDFIKEREIPFPEIKLARLRKEMDNVDAD